MFDTPPAAAAVVAPTEPRALVRYAHGVRRHLDDDPGHLVPYARALDQQLLAGAFDDRPDDVIAVVDALLAIRRELGSRAPSELAEFRSTGSPLDGMIEDITPFGNVDMWHAARSAALARRTTAHHHHRDGGAATTTAGGDGDGGGAETTADTTGDEGTIGTHGGGTSALRAGREIADEIERDADHTAGDWSTALDGGSLAYDTITQFIAVSELVEIGAMAVQPLLATVSLVLSMEASWQQTQQGLRAWGMRCALVSLDTPFAHYPITLTRAELEAHILDSPARSTWVSNVVHATAYEAGDAGEPVALGRRGVGEVAARVNKAIHRAEASPALARALREADPELRERIQQDLRREMYHRIHEAAADRLADD